MHSGRLLREVNATILTLVPKKKNPTTMEDYRPISCCNLIYKSITKILANGLLLGLDDIISANQGAFIPKRSIAKNILLAQEAVNKEKGNSRCTLKVDLMKAYDSVSWDLLFIAYLALVLHLSILLGSRNVYLAVDILLL